MKFATVDGNGLPIGFYDDKVHGADIPVGAIEVTDDEWRELLMNPGRRRLDVGLSPRVVAHVPSPKPITVVKDAAIRRIKGDAESARAALLTPGAGKSMAYEEKRRECERYAEVVAAGGTPEAVDYPWMADRAGRLSVTLADVYDEWTGRMANWRDIGRRIEGLEEAAVEQVKALTNETTAEAEADAIISNIVWPSGG